ncbi:hypothetical protein Ais01nite_35550 [Asanoa ishikariensis]|nr:hypothetical protein Ais01nite_35550 [Asanoa ishikariensis]
MTTETVRVGVHAPISGGCRTLQSLRKIRTGSFASFGVGTVVSVSSQNQRRLDATLIVPVDGGLPAQHDGSVAWRRTSTRIVSAGGGSTRDHGRRVPAGGRL